MQRLVERRCIRQRLCFVHHDSDKLLFAYLAILIEVKLVYHCL